MPINVQSGGIIFATPNNATHKAKVDLRSISILTIRLTDERNRLLDLNGLHFQIAISLDFVYGRKFHGGKQGSLGDGGQSFHDPNEYLVKGEDKTKQIQAFREKQLQEAEEQERQSRRRGPGRPRRS